MDTSALDFADFFDHLVRYETELWDVADTRLQADHRLPLTWFEPMQVIARRTECRIQDISDALAITVGGTSKLVDRIERAGYCERRTDPADRRSSLIALTPVGQETLAAAQRTFLAELKAAVGGVPEEDLVRFLDTLQALRQFLHRTRTTTGSPMRHGAKD